MGVGYIWAPVIPSQPPWSEHWPEQIAARNLTLMKLAVRVLSWVRLATLSSLAFAWTTAQAQTGGRAMEDAFALNACLTAWGNHPFGSRPTYTTLTTSVKISGAGPATTDRNATDHPSLILVDALVNTRGDASLALSNPNGWYCLRVPANELGALRIQLHCRARLAAASGGATVWSTGQGAARVTMLGSMPVERVGCDGG